MATPYAILYLICSISIIILGYFVHQSVYKLLKRRGVWKYPQMSHLNFQNFSYRFWWAPMLRNETLWVFFKHCFVRLKKRALNKIVYPSMVVNSISVPLILLFMSLRNIYYPMKSVIGQNGCYIYMAFNFWRWQFYQFHSFFIALFRYTILYHPKFLATFKIDPKVSFNF